MVKVNHLTEEYISYKDIVSYIDIQKGDIIYVASDVLRLLCVCRQNGECFDPHLFIDSITHKVGPEGTVLFPTYSQEFCKGRPFDYRYTPSTMGALTNVALKRKDFKRTKHPVYSFVVWGKDQNHLCQLNNINATGLDSPFDYFYRNQAKIFFIGLDYKEGLTSVHYAEEKVGVKYRHLKEFTALYIDEHGISKRLTYRVYVRYPHLCSATKIHPCLDNILLERKAYLKYFMKGVYFGLVNLQVVGDIMEKDIRVNGGLVYPIL